MKRKTKKAPGARRIVWQDLHVIDPTTYPRQNDDARLCARGGWSVRLAPYEWRVLDLDADERDRDARWGVFRRRIEETEASFLPVGLFAATSRAATTLLERALARGGSVEDALEEERRSEALRDLLVGIGGQGFAGAGEPAPSLEEAFVRGLRVLARDLARRGFALTPRGQVLEPWRARARGRWVASDLVFPSHGQPGTGDSWHRVEAGRVLAVWDENGDGESYLIEVDGKSAGSCSDPEVAKRMAVDLVRARRRGDAA